LTLWYDHPARTGTPDGGVAVVFSNFGVSGPLVPPDKVVCADPIYRVTKAGGGGYGSLYMNEAMPLGNGPLGALVFGGTSLERIALSEISLWSGDEHPGGWETMGYFETLGNLWVELPGHEGATAYRRQLDLDGDLKVLSGTGTK
jgi:hypothetical protein